MITSMEARYVHCRVLGRGFREDMGTWRILLILGRLLRDYCCYFMVMPCLRSAQLEFHHSLKKMIDYRLLLHRSEMSRYLALRVQTFQCR